MTRLPDQVKALFWEGLSEEPDPDRHGDYIAIRVLEVGDEAAVRWLLDRYGAQHVGRVVSSGRLRPCAAGFWRRVLVDA
jgi:hypothetical protein